MCLAQSPSGDEIVFPQDLRQGETGLPAYLREGFAAEARSGTLFRNTVTRLRETAAIVDDACAALGLDDQLPLPDSLFNLPDVPPPPPQQQQQQSTGFGCTGEDPFMGWPTAGDDERLYEVKPTLSPNREKTKLVLGDDSDEDDDGDDDYDDNDKGKNNKDNEAQATDNARADGPQPLPDWLYVPPALPSTIWEGDHSRHVNMRTWNWNALPPETGAGAADPYGGFGSGWRVGPSSSLFVGAGAGAGAGAGTSASASATATMSKGSGQQAQTGSDKAPAVSGTRSWKHKGADDAAPQNSYWALAVAAQAAEDTLYPGFYG